MDPNIKSGIIWNSISSFAKYGLQFVGVMILARLLCPEDFAAIGILTIFISIADIIIDAGLGGALIKKENATIIDYSTLTVFNLVVSLLVFIVFYLVAPFVSDFYENDSLSPLLRLYSIVVLIHAISIAPRVYLTKQLNFKYISLVYTSSGLIGLLVAIVMAYYEFGAYSLVGQYIATALVIAVFFIVKSKVKIQFSFSVVSFREQFSFGANTTGANALKAIFENVYNNVVAKCASLQLTGFYAQGFRLSTVPINFIYGLIDNTLFPVLSQERDENKFCVQIVDLNRKIVALSSFLFGLAIAVVDYVVLFVLGDQWIGIEGTLCFLFAVGHFITINNLARNILKCKGFTSDILKTEVVVSVINIIGLSFAYFYGYWAILIVYLSVSVIKAIYVTYVASKKASLPFGQIIFDYLKITLIVCCLIGISLLIPEMNAFLRVVCIVLLFGLGYFCFNKYYFAGRKNG